MPAIDAASGTRKWFELHSARVVPAAAAAVLQLWLPLWLVLCRLLHHMAMLTPLLYKYVSMALSPPRQAARTDSQTTVVVCGKVLKNQMYGVPGAAPSAARGRVAHWQTNPFR